MNVTSVRIINPKKLKSLHQTIINSRQQMQYKMSELFNLLEVNCAQDSDAEPTSTLITLTGFEGELLAQAESNPRPVWIISHPSGTGHSPLVMYANSAALKANHREAEDLIGEPYLQLWQPKSLREVVNRLWSPRACLDEFESQGFRFGESSWGDRVEYRFFANYRRVTFMGGTPCWQEEVLGAVAI